MLASTFFLLLRRSSSWYARRRILFLDGGGGSSRRAFCTTTTSSSASDDPAEAAEVDSKAELLHQEGFTEQQIKAVLSTDPRSDKLAWLLTLLKSRGIASTTAGAFLCSNPALLKTDLNSVRRKLEVLEDAGLEDTLLKKAILMKTGILSLSTSPENLQKHVSFLKDIGMDPFSMCLTMARFPEFVQLSIEKNVKPRCELLYSKGVSKGGLCQIFRNYPRVFSGSENPGLTKKLELLRRFGFDLEAKSGVRALGLWSITGHVSLLAKFEYMQTIGFSQELAVAMVRKQPNILCLRQESLRMKVDYLVHFLHRDIQELLSCPSFLTSSLEKRLIPRFTVVNQLKEKGLLEKHIPISSIVSVADKAFEKRFKVQDS